MNRRGFLRILPAVVGGVALEQVIPLGRVWSFSKKIVVPKYFMGFDPAYGPDMTAVHWYTMEEIAAIHLRVLKESLTKAPW